jgi:hypothetical protein
VEKHKNKDISRKPAYAKATAWQGRQAAMKNDKNNQGQAVAD